MRAFQGKALGQSCYANGIFHVQSRGFFLYLTAETYKANRNDKPLHEQEIVDNEGFTHLGSF